MDTPKVREIVAHRTPSNPVNAEVKVIAVDARVGGASHCYQIQPHNGVMCTINFQNGTVAEHGVNGVTQEALLAVVADRLHSFQAGPFPCDENRIALTHVELALDALHARTRDRVRRGVEGKIVP